MLLFQSSAGEQGASLGEAAHLSLELLLSDLHYPLDSHFEILGEDGEQ